MHKVQRNGREHPANLHLNSLRMHRNLQRAYIVEDVRLAKDLLKGFWKLFRGESV